MTSLPPSAQANSAWDPAGQPVLVEDDLGGPPLEYFLAETLDGLYTPYALRVPSGDGPHPFVLIARGNGGGGMAWLQDCTHRFRHITDRLLEEGYACAWTRYRTEVELGYASGGELQASGRHGRATR